jgi:uncharacterized iron-regulated protein
MKICISLFVLFFLSGCLITSKNHSSSPKINNIWDVNSKTFLTDKQFLQRLMQRRFILLGEKHDNAAHHVKQSNIISHLIAANLDPIIAFEMIYETQQALVDGYKGSALEFGPYVGWEKRGWPEWTTYQPILDVALEKNLKIIGVDLSREQIRHIYKGETVKAIPLQRQEDLQLNHPLPKDILETMLNEQHQAHCGLMPKSKLGPMVNIQWSKDAIMADNMFLAAQKYPNQTPVVLIAGAGHVRNDRAIPYHLIKRINTPVSKADILTIGLLEIDDEIKDITEYNARYGDRTSPLPFDIVIFSGIDQNYNYCDDLKKRM